MQAGMQEESQSRPLVHVFIIIDCLIALITPKLQLVFHRQYKKRLRPNGQAGSNSSNALENHMCSPFIYEHW